MHMHGPVYNPFPVLLLVLGLGAYTLVLCFALIGLRNLLGFGFLWPKAFVGLVGSLYSIFGSHFICFFIFSPFVHVLQVNLWLLKTNFYCLPKDRNKIMWAFSWNSLIHFPPLTVIHSTLPARMMHSWLHACACQVYYFYLVKFDEDVINKSLRMMWILVY